MHLYLHWLFNQDKMNVMCRQVVKDARKSIPARVQSSAVDLHADIAIYMNILILYKRGEYVCICFFLFKRKPILYFVLLISLQFSRLLSHF